MGKHREPEGLGCLLSFRRAGASVSISTRQAGARTERETSEAPKNPTCQPGGGRGTTVNGLGMG